MDNHITIEIHLFVLQNVSTRTGDHEMTTERTYASGMKTRIDSKVTGDDLVQVSQNTICRMIMAWGGFVSKSAEHAIYEWSTMKKILPFTAKLQVYPVLICYRKILFCFFQSTIHGTTWLNEFSFFRPWPIWSPARRRSFVTRKLNMLVVFSSLVKYVLYGFAASYEQINSIIGSVLVQRSYEVRKIGYWSTLKFLNAICSVYV